MKIICVTQRFFPAIGGAEQLIERLMDYLAPRHQIVVYTSNALRLDSFWNNKLEPVSDIQSKNYQIKRYGVLQPCLVSENLVQHPLSVSYPGPFCPQMWDDLLNMKDKADLIIACSFPYDHVIPAFVASKKHKIPFIVVPLLHLQYPEYYFTGTKLAILNDSNAIVVMTNAEKQTLIDLKIEEKKIHIIPAPISIYDDGKRRNLKKELKINIDSIIVLFAGTMSDAKGIIHLVEALKRLWNNHENFDLVLIGANTEEFKAHIKRQDQKTLSRIHNLGLVPDEVKWDAFFSCDIFAMPSKSESLGLVYLEAWKFKKPVIGCDISSIREVIDNNENGFLVKFGDVEQLTSTIKTLQDSSLRKKFGEKGYEKLKKIFDSDTIYKQFEELCLKMESQN